ncbi:MAG: DUF302 domain-containing protein [Hyphomicrobiaceae bacterium]|nr:DUF302 domain-containing protein [Hyphomicrobiaceae bacterium]
MPLRAPSAMAAAATLLLAALGSMPARAQDLRTYAKAAAFDDVKFELNNAIIAKGLVIEATGAIGAMLERTGPDIGATTPIYRNAEYLTFCSAVLSRRMMEADPVNVGYCPYVVFIYERVDRPGETVVGYRRPPQGSSDAARKAFADIDKLLDDIVREAVQ